MMARMRLSFHCSYVALTGLLLSGACHSLSAQSVQGTVVDAATGAVVGTGFIVLLDSDSVEAARVLWSRDGRFNLRAPGGGTYRLRSERIGYQAFVSEPFEIPPSGSIVSNLHIDALPIRLTMIQVRGRDRCRINPEIAAETGLIWEEIRKALAATAWSAGQTLYRYRRYRYSRELSQNRREIRKETGRTIEEVTTRPYASLPARQLAEQGYIVVRGNEVSYYIPDVQVLLDDSFLAGHCFYVRRDPTDHAGLVGLAFDPVNDAPSTDVRGVLWLDESTSELRTLEVSFTELPYRAQDDRVGGTVDFMRLPSGAWIVQRWEIRTPVLRRMGSNDPAIRTQRDKAYVRGFRDVGGEILEVTARDGTKTYPAALAQVSGSVYDSTKAGPLAGVRVTINGTDFWTNTGRDGEFRLAVPLEGDYQLSFSHPWLDSIGYRSPDRKIALARMTEHAVSFAIPSVSGMGSRLCGDDGIGVGRRAIIGVVRNEAGAPVADARVNASWQEIVPSAGKFAPIDLAQSSIADDGGFFAVCGIPVGRLVRVQAEHRGDRSRAATLIYPRVAGGELLQSWDREPGEMHADSYIASHPIWRLDFELRGGQPRTSQTRTVSGIVADRMTGFGLEAVSVSLNDRDTTTTRADGTFDIVGAEWNLGGNVVAFRRVGYREWTQQLQIDEDRVLVELSVLLRPSAITVDPVIVEADRIRRSRYLGNVGFYERQQRGFGFQVSPESIDQRVEAVSDVYDFLAGVPGVTVMELPEPTEDGLSGRVMMLGHGVGRCVPRMYVDGRELLGFDGSVELLGTVVWPEDVYAIELYSRASDAPVEYSALGEGCVVLLWTRVGAPRP